MDKDIIDFEVDEIRKITENVISNSKIVTCMRSLVISTKLLSFIIRCSRNDIRNFTLDSFFFFLFFHFIWSNLQIRIDIRQTDSRQITLCIRFPANYPNQHVLLELKSRSLSGKLLDGLTTLAEQKAKEFLGKRQVRQFSLHARIVWCNW